MKLIKRARVALAVNSKHRVSPLKRSSGMPADPTALHLDISAAVSGGSGRPEVSGSSREGTARGKEGKRQEPGKPVVLIEACLSTCYSQSSGAHRPKGKGNRAQAPASS